MPARVMAPAAPDRKERHDSSWRASPKRDREDVSLQDETTSTLEEARVVLPGIQAIFGFQLVAALNDRFESLLQSQRVLHLCALVLVALAVALVMAPAAYHRISERGQVSRDFIDLASRFITAALVPVMLGIGLDVFVIAWVVVHDPVIGAAVAIALAVTFGTLWFVLPWRHRARMGRAHPTRLTKR